MQLLHTVHSFKSTCCSDGYNRYKVKNLGSPITLKSWEYDSSRSFLQGGGLVSTIDFEELNRGLGMDSVLTIKSAESETGIWFPDLCICRIFCICLSHHTLIILQILGKPLTKGMHGRRDGVYENSYFKGLGTVGYCSHFIHSPRDISYSSDRFIRGGSLMWCKSEKPIAIMSRGIFGSFWSLLDGPSRGVSETCIQLWTTDPEGVPPFWTTETSPHLLIFDIHSGQQCH